MPGKTPTGRKGAAQAAPKGTANRLDRSLRIGESDQSIWRTSQVPADPSNLPQWHAQVHLFDGLEISPCVTVNFGDGQSSIEVCDDPAKAEFWSVYGHYNPALCDGFGGVDCLEDFATETHARAFAAELRRLHPHLRGR